jgi:hypothetical protein
MPSRSEGWGGLFKVRAQRAPYKCPRSAPIDKEERFAGIIRWLRVFEQIPGASRHPSLLKEGNKAKPGVSNIKLLGLPSPFVLDKFGHKPRL